MVVTSLLMYDVQCMMCDGRRECADNCNSDVDSISFRGES